MNNFIKNWRKHLFPFAGSTAGISMVETLIAVGVMGVSAWFVAGAIKNTQMFKASQEDRSRLDALRSYAATALSCDNTMTKSGVRDLCITDGEHVIGSYRSDNSELASSAGSTTYGKYNLRSMCNKNGVHFQAKSAGTDNWQDLGNGIPVFCPETEPMGTPMKWFFVGAEDRPFDPDPYPYGDFFMCFNGDFNLDNKGIVRSTSTQTIKFQLYKYSGCDYYTWTTVIKSADGKTIKQSIPRLMAGENASGVISADIESGDIVSGTLQVLNGRGRGGGGCVGRTVTLESRNFVSLIPEPEFPKYAGPAYWCK